MKNKIGVAVSIGLSVILPFAFPDSVVEGVRVQCEKGVQNLSASFAAFIRNFNLNVMVPSFDTGQALITSSTIRESSGGNFRSSGVCSTLFLATLLIGVLSGCTTFKPVVDSDSMSQEARASTRSKVVIEGEYGILDGPEKNRSDSRPGTAVVQGVTLLTKTNFVDPIIRPFSYAKAYYGLALKSVGGILQRSTINQFQFSLLKDNPVPPVADAEPMDLDLWEQELDKIVGTKPLLGKVRFLIDGDEYFSRLTEAFDEAEDKINIRTYIFDNDDVGLEIADILRRKSSDVKVKVVVDGLGDLFATNSDSHSMPEDIELPASITNYLKYGSKVRVRVQSNPWFTGDHVKTTIVDEKLAFVGGMNIGREYRYDWHDMMMEVSGPVVKKLQYEFDKTWAKSGFLGDFALFTRAIRGYKRGPEQNGYPVRVMSTSIHNSGIFRAQLAAIKRAKNRIYIQNAYFSDDRILYELAKARRRGVDVRVIVSSENDSGAMDLSNESTINAMLKNGIRVYSYPGMTHLKAAVYDGWACLGSANFDKMSLQINQEINLGISHPETVQILMDRVFIPDFAASTELHEFIPMRWTHRLAELIADEAL